MHFEDNMANAQNSHSSSWDILRFSGWTLNDEIKTDVGPQAGWIKKGGSNRHVKSIQ